MQLVMLPDDGLVRSETFTCRRWRSTKYTITTVFICRLES